MSKVNHTFVICAYKESPFLEETVKSIINQTVKSHITISTSTPNKHIESISEKYGITLLINRSDDAMTMAGDWNFAYESSKTDYVTLAHQDDFYEPDYLEQILKKAYNKKPIIIFSDYYELRDGKKIFSNRLLRIKKIMNLGFKFFPKSRFVRRRVLSFGCSICCPAVTFYKPVCHNFKFDSRLINDLDWDAWTRLSDRKGQFLYINKPLMGHRIHMESSTTKYIESGVRFNENLEMFRRFWPEWIAKKIVYLYEKSDKSNSL